MYYVLAKNTKDNAAYLVVEVGYPNIETAQDLIDYEKHFDLEKNWEFKIIEW